MARYTDTAPYKLIGKSEAWQKYTQQTTNIGTSAFSTTVWKQTQTLPLSTELVTHSRASERRQKRNDHQLFFWSVEPRALWYQVRSGVWAYFQRLKCR